MEAMEPLKGFPKKIEAALEEGKFSYARKLFTQDNVKLQSPELITVIAKYLKEETQPELFRCCEYLLDILSQVSNPDEAVYQIVTEIELAENDLKVITLLEPLAKMICRIETRRLVPIIWSCLTIHLYLQKCDAPDYENFDGKERLLVENSQVVSNLRNLLERILSFYDTCAQYKSDQEIKNILIKFLVQLLGFPVSSMHVELFGQVKTDGRILSERVVNEIVKLMSNPFAIIEVKEQYMELDPLGIANLFYLIYCEGFGEVPQVYSGGFIFETTLYSINVLCKNDAAILCEKGLKLAETVLLYVKNQKLSYICLDNEEHQKFCLILSDLMGYHQNGGVRARALQIFTNYLKAFEIKGIYLIFVNLFDTLSHSGLKGHIITLYKDFLDQEFNNEYFKGPKLLRLLKKFCLIELEDAFILDHSNEIVSALNLLRYLVSRDKNNETLIWNYIELIQREFLEPLEKGIEVSRTRFTSELKNMNEENEQIEMTVNINKEKLQQFHKEEKLKSLNSIITTLDLIESLLNRLKEILENK